MRENVSKRRHDIVILGCHKFSTHDFFVWGHEQTIFVTVNRIGPLLMGEGVQLKLAESVTFVMKIEIGNISSILK